MRKSLCFVLALLIIIVQIASGCSSRTTSTATQPSTTLGTASPRGNIGTITTGITTTVSTTDVTPEGRIISIDNPGDPLNGFVIDVPAGAYDNNLAFKVSYAPITKQTFGDLINPASPLITVENGGGFSEEPMYIRVPVKIPDGSFAMGFFYDNKTGQIEGMPLVSYDAESVTLCTRHFSDFFVSIVEKALINKAVEMSNKDIDSHFRPGIDDWQFTNFGSFIAPDGHCRGQSIAAMWYYLNQPDGKDLTLYGRYDNNGKQPKTPELWQDDSLGYRLCSTIQKDTVGEEYVLSNVSGNTYVLVNNKWTRVDVPGIGDEANWFLFAYSMMVTKQPQMVGIFSNVGGGHAMICYRIYQGHLYIADPNYPGNTERRIEYSFGEFLPYNSGANREEIDKGNGKTYERIIYYGNWSMIENEIISKRWNELKKGTIGNDLFPAYQIKYKDKDGNYQELKDGYVSNEKSIDIRATFNIAIYRDGKALPWDAKNYYELKPGNNLLGVYIYKKLNPNTANEKNLYIDFKYINVIYEEPETTTPTVTTTPTLIRMSLALKPEEYPQGWKVNFKFEDPTPDDGEAVSYSFSNVNTRPIENWNVKFYPGISLNARESYMFSDPVKGTADAQKMLEEKAASMMSYYISHTSEFKVTVLRNEPTYRLWRVDEIGKTVNDIFYVGVLRINHYQIDYTVKNEGAVEDRINPSVSPIDPDATSLAKMQAEVHKEASTSLDWLNQLLKTKYGVK